MQDRVPYFIDQFGRLIPYSEEQIAQNKAARQWPIPHSEPTYEQLKKGEMPSNKVPDYNQEQAEAMKDVVK